MKKNQAKNGCKKEKNFTVKAKISSSLSTVEPGTGGFVRIV